jgi:hypothetical protein
MLGQKPQKFDAGVAGAADDACLDHAFVPCEKQKAA